jgi:hypothetical protein
VYFRIRPAVSTATQNVELAQDTASKYFPESIKARDQVEPLKVNE